MVGVAGLKVRTPVDFAGGQPVTEHFCHIFFGHFNACDAFSVDTVVCPIFKVVAIAAFMMHPGSTVSDGTALCVIGAAVPLVIFYTGPKFYGRIFGQVMCQSLPVEPQPETMLPHQPPMLLNGFQMLPKSHRIHLKLL